MSHTVTGNTETAPYVARARRNTVGDLLTRTRARYPKKLALVYEDVRWTYQQFDDAVHQTAHALSEDGVDKGARVAVLSRNSLDFAVINFALARLGATMVPINYMLNAEEIAYILQHAEVSCLTASGEFAPLLDQACQLSGRQPSIVARYLMDTSEVPADLAHWVPLQARRAAAPMTPFESDVSDDDVAHVLYTSGTESRPKGVMLTHANLISEYVSCIVDGRMEARDVAIHALPLYHSAQLNCFLGPGVYVGATGIILRQAAPDAILETIERESATQLFCPPTVWIALLRHPDFSTRDLLSLEKCYYGAAIMPVEVLKELSQRLPQAKFWNFYGQTEVAPLATVLQPEDQFRKLGSAGRPSLNVETKIVDDDGNELPPGQIGEIVHRTAHAMKGYWKDPEKTAEAFKDGWFHSGDLGVMDEEGYLTVIDRKKDMIKSGGVNVSSREVEEVVYQFPSVSEVAVIGVPDSYWIEAVTAVVVPKPGEVIDVDSLLAHCKEKLARFKVPKHVVVVDELPKNPSGKVLKRELRARYKDLA
jgi:fatty-acyl-CoA synthase